MRGAFRRKIFQCKSESPEEIHKQIVAVYGNPAISTCFFTSRWEKFDDDDEVQEEVMT
jgi:hypothetical protein